jgi:hypothetical protein
MTSPGPGYNYVALRELRINNVIAFEPGQWVPDSTIATQGWVVNTDISAPGAVIPSPAQITSTNYGTYLAGKYAAPFYPSASGVFIHPSRLAAVRTAVGVCSDDGSVFLAESSNGIRRTLDYGVHLYALGTPAQSASTAALSQVYQWNGYLYAIFTDSTDGNKNKLFRAAQVAYGGTYTWSGPLLTLTAGSLGYGYTITGTATALLVAEYGDPTGGPTLWRSTDGTTFTAALTLPGARHIHCVAADPYNPGQVWLSFGDNVDNCYQVSTDHGATWTQLPFDRTWQGTQLSFTPDWIYVAPDPGVDTSSLYLIDRKSRTIRVGTSGHHQDLRLRNPGVYTRGVTTSGSATFTDADGPFATNDVGRHITGAGIPNGATITAYASKTSVTLSANATASATITYQIDRQERPLVTAFHGAVDPATGIYYGVTNSDSGSVGVGNGRAVLFMVPYPGGPVVGLGDLSTASGPGVFIDSISGFVWYGDNYRPLIAAPYVK